MAYDSIPSSVSDVLMHGKDSDRTERIMLPFITDCNNCYCQKICDSCVRKITPCFL